MTPGQAAETMAALEAKVNAETQTADPLRTVELWDAAVDRSRDWGALQRGRRLL